MKAIACGVLAAAACVLPAFRSAQETGPEQRQADFLRILKENKIEEAYADIFKGSTFPPGEVARLVQATVQGRDTYGGFTESENLGLTRKDKLVSIGMAVVGTQKRPLFFYFAWYRKTEASPWAIVSLWFNDQIKEYMDYRR